MILKRSEHISLQLSLYIDGELANEERMAIKALIDSKPEVREEYEHLKAMHVLLAAREPVAENPFLAERIMNRIREQAEEEEDFIFLPRRYLPVTASLAVVILAAIATFAWLQRDQIFQYVADTGSQVQHAYEESILKGWIMPLFERTDRDQVLHFAMFGTLPLGGGDGTVLRVDESASDGYRIELANEDAFARPVASMEDFYDEIQPTDTQRKVFDTLFLYAQRQIESSVLMNENKELAIDPALSKYHKVILSGIAASLEPDQLVRFEHFLNERNTPYTFVSHVSHGQPMPAEPPANLINQFRTAHTPEAYVVLSSDSMSPTTVRLDMDSLRRLMKIVENRVPRLDIRFEQLARTYKRRAQRYEQQTKTYEQQVRSSMPSDKEIAASARRSPVHIITGEARDGRHSVTITIASDAAGLPQMENELHELMRNVAILKRDEVELQLSQRSRSPERSRQSERSVQIMMLPDSEIQIRVNVDSIVMNALEPLKDFDLNHNLEFDVESFNNRSSSEWRQMVPDIQYKLLDSLRERLDWERRSFDKSLRELREPREPQVPRKMRELPEPQEPQEPREHRERSRPVKKDSVYEI